MRLVSQAVSTEKVFQANSCDQSDQLKLVLVNCPGGRKIEWKSGEEDTYTSKNKPQKLSQHKTYPKPWNCIIKCPVNTPGCPDTG